MLARGKTTREFLTMLRYLGLLILALLWLAGPAAAVTANEKMETCKVGAEAQNLSGAKAQAFIKRCMAKGNYEPPARRAEKRKGAAAKKPAPSAATQPAPDAEEPDQKQ
jgi:hypothetical protein